MADKIKAVAKTIKAPKASAKTPVKAPVNAAVKAPAKAPVKEAAAPSSKVPAKAPVKAPAELAFGVQPYSLKTSEEYMNSAQQKHFKELLRTWRATLVTKLDTAVSHLKDEPKHFADLNDRATQEEEFNLELKARDREADLVSKIDEALKNLHDGDYGYCEECGIEIGIRRLEARPTATLCIDCKTLAEMRERQAGGL